MTITGGSDHGSTIGDDRQVWTVSELTRRIKGLLEANFPAFWVEGEISNLRVPTSGHAYFTLKDESSQIKAVLFRNRARRIRFEPQDGLSVLVFGGLDLYAPKGEYQLVVELLEPKGLGALQLAFEQLKAKLDAEGLFDPARKRSIPLFPRKIGIVTSPTGAAIRDILRIISRRFADLHILIYPARVQGEEAAGEIVRGIQEFCRMGGLDVLILARGGGSLEDLWAFNEEAVARAIAASEIPVISAVGHETDVTIADFVADLRAPTPSAAAEMVVQEKAAIIGRVADLSERFHRSARRQVERLWDRLAELRGRRAFADPARTMRDHVRRLDDLTLRLESGLRLSRQRAWHRADRLIGRLRLAGPLAKITNGATTVAHLHGRCEAALRRRLDVEEHRFESLVGRLEGLSPLAVLRRGYSLTRLPSGDVVSATRQVKPGADVWVLLHEGSLDCRVVKIRDSDDRPHV